MKTKQSDIIFQTNVKKPSRLLNMIAKLKIIVNLSICMIGKIVRYGQKKAK